MKRIEEIYMSTNPQNKRITKQIRVSENLHRIVKFEAIKKGKTISMFIDEIIEKYFANKDKSQKHYER